MKIQSIQLADLRPPAHNPRSVIAAADRARAHGSPRRTRSAFGPRWLRPRRIRPVDAPQVRLK